MGLKLLRIASLSPAKIRLACYSNSFLFVLSRLFGVIFILFLCVPGMSLPADAQEIVVNPNLKKEHLSLNALRAMFGMRLRNWPDGTPVKVFVLNDDSKLHASFSKKKLEIFPHQLRYAWDRLVYSGTGQAPTKVDSEEEMREMVASTPGAIGYLPLDLVDETVHMLNIQAQ